MMYCPGCGAPQDYEGDRITGDYEYTCDRCMNRFVVRVRRP